MYDSRFKSYNEMTRMIEVMAVSKRTGLEEKGRRERQINKRIKPATMKFS